jgi:hypothetical protein
VLWQVACLLRSCLAASSGSQNTLQRMHWLALVLCSCCLLHCAIPQIPRLELSMLAVVPWSSVNRSTEYSQQLAAARQAAAALAGGPRLLLIQSSDTMPQFSRHQRALPVILSPYAIHPCQRAEEEVHAEIFEAVKPLLPQLPHISLHLHHALHLACTRVIADHLGPTTTRLHLYLETYQPGKSNLALNIGTILHMIADAV